MNSEDKDFSRRRRGRGGHAPYRRRKNRHPGLAERELPKEPPKPKGELPEQFASNVFGLLNPLLQHAVAEEGYLQPTPIQEQAIPHLLSGSDLLGCAQTGTGKTAAFLLPILHRLAADTENKAQPGLPRALVLAPTRELAAQIAECCGEYGKFLGMPFAVVFGGVGQNPQVKALQRGAEIVIATPGRLFDLMEQGHVSLSAVREFVLDEADRMLDMGFLPDIKKILPQLPPERHTQFFSATLSKEIRKLAAEMVTDPVEITISPEQPTVDRINQMLMFVDKGDKPKLLLNLLEEHPEYYKVLVFARTRHGADKIVRTLRDGNVSAEAIHSDKTQRMRTNTLNAFRNGKVRVLVATDIASRGIDVDSITHVINYDLPEETESYIHRIGRTARAGASGAAISFVSAEERGLLRAVERLIKREIDICRDQPYHSEKAERAAGKSVDENGDFVPPWRQRKERTERRARRPSNLGRRQPDFHHSPLEELDEPPKPEKPAFKHPKPERPKPERSKAAKTSKRSENEENQVVESHWYDEPFSRNLKAKEKRELDEDQAEFESKLARYDQEIPKPPKRKAPKEEKREKRPRFERGGQKRFGEREEKPRFGGRKPGFREERREERPRFERGGRKHFGEREERPRFGGRKPGFREERREERPRFERGGRKHFGEREERPRFGGRKPGFRGGERSERPRFGRPGGSVAGNRKPRAASPGRGRPRSGSFDRFKKQRGKPRRF